MRGLHHREPGVVGHVLLNPDVMVGSNYRWYSHSPGYGEISI